MKSAHGMIAVGVGVVLLVVGGMMLIINGGGRRGGPVAVAMTAPATTTVAPATPALAPPPVASPAVRRRFLQVYGLKYQEWVKRVPRPFVPERDAYLLAGQPAWGSPAAMAQFVAAQSYFFREDGWGVRQSGAVPGDADLETLMFRLGLGSWQMVGPDALLKMKLPGDWVYADEATAPMRMAALETVLTRDLGRPIRIKARTITRDVVVARGSITVTGPVDASGRLTIDVFMPQPGQDAQAAAARATYATTVREALATLERWSRTPVVDESSVGAARVVILTRSGPIRDPDPMTDANWAVMLESLRRQTGLDVTREQRAMEVWEVGEGRE